VDAGNRHAAGDRVVCEPGSFPIGGKEHRDEMAPGRIAANDDALCVGAVRRAFAREPDDRAPAFADDRRDADVRAEIVIDDGDRDLLGNERGIYREALCRAPIAAVQS
jgi:hypothetical protein